jgi:hypothetical protein
MICARRPIVAREQQSEHHMTGLVPPPLGACILHMNPCWRPLRNRPVSRQSCALSAEQNAVSFVASALQQQKIFQETFSDLITGELRTRAVRIPGASPLLQRLAVSRRTSEGCEEDRGEVRLQ